MKTGRTGVAAAVILMLAAVPASLCSAQAQTQPPEWPNGPPLEARVPFHDGSIGTLLGALELSAAQLELWAPMEAQLRAAVAARQKMRGSMFQPFYASLSEKQKDVASVLLRPFVDEPWPRAAY